MLLSELKTIDIFAKQWRDKINGNSYFSSRVVLNLDYENELIIEMMDELIELLDYYYFKI